jgi:hypothetical protein
LESFIDNSFYQSCASGGSFCVIVLPFRGSILGYQNQHDDYNDFNDEDHFYDDEIDNDIDEISNGEGSGEPDTGRTGLE